MRHQNDMGEDLMDNFKVIYRILRYLERAMDLDEPDMQRISTETLGLSEQRWAAIIEMLVAEKYIDGMAVSRSIDGGIVMSVSNPRITLRGLEYLHDNSIMQKMAKVAKGIVDIAT